MMTNNLQADIFNNYQYQSFKGDPSKMRVYTLKNGLTVYLSQNKDEPRIQTYIAVRAGSNNDPADNTGLAHYLEHMLFKGTSKLGTIDFKKEKVLLDKISDLYEIHKQEKDSVKRKEIYKKIDNISQKASEYAIASEYDKAIAAIGGLGTNAHTWLNETIYKNDIPSNEVARWLNLEKERMSELVLRLFHTELETVYEEYNRYQDNTMSQVFTEILKNLFPNSNYGKQSTIGLPEHLKSPSMKAIHKYFDKYYVPSNMAIILVGDLDYDKTIKLIDQTFGQLPVKPTPEEYIPSEQDFEKDKKITLVNLAPEQIYVSYRLPKIQGNEINKFLIVNELLNGKIGLLNLNINLPQKALNVGTENLVFKDYAMHMLIGDPKAGQSLEELEKIIDNEFNKIKQGKFEDWMIDAIIKNLKKKYTIDLTNRTRVAMEAYENFINHRSWDEFASFSENISSITKQDIIDFVKNNYKNKLVLYKKQGNEDNILHVEKPEITPIKLNQGKDSAFYKDFIKQKVEPIQPVFLDFNKQIKKTPLSDHNTLYSIENKDNDLDLIAYVTNLGSDHDRKLSLALEYAKYLGTNKYSPSELQQELYKLGIDLSWITGYQRTFITIKGLSEDIPKGIDILEEIINNLKPSDEIYQNFVNNILQQRENFKNENQTIVGALVNYAKYEKNNRLTDIFSEKELKSFKPEDLIKEVKDYFNYKHDIFYYGTDLDKIKNKILSIHNLGNNKPIPNKKEYKGQESKNQVYFYSYPQAQVSINFINKGKIYDNKDVVLSELYNMYFGQGLSSIVFQQIREAKSLAYSVSSHYVVATRKNNENYLYASMGTQVDKLQSAIESLQNLLNNDLELSEDRFNNAKSTLLKKLSTIRYNREQIFYRWIGIKDLGFDFDINRDIYTQAEKSSLTDLKKFFNENIKNKKYNYAIMGDKNKINQDLLKKLGEIKEVSTEEIFGF